MTKNEFISAIATVAVDFQSDLLKVLEEYGEGVDEEVVLLKANKEINERIKSLDARERKIIEMEEALRKKNKEFLDKSHKLSMQKYKMDVKESDLNKIKQILESGSELLDDIEKKLLINIIDYAIFHGYWVSDRLDKLKMDYKDVNNVLRKLGLPESKINEIGI